MTRIRMIKNETRSSYIPALRFKALTPTYDHLMRYTMRELTFKSALIEQAGLKPKWRILDVGCGTGKLTAMTKAAARDSEVIGIDADDHALAIARKRAANSGLQIHFDQASATALPFEASYFDCAFSSLMFHHLTTDAKLQALQEIRRVLRTAAELHIADWGRPHDALMRIAFLGVQLLDGFSTTGDNVAGRLPDICRESGFAEVIATTAHRTLFGTLRLYRCRK